MCTLTCSIVSVKGSIIFSSFLVLRLQSSFETRGGPLESKGPASLYSKDPHCCCQSDAIEAADFSISSAECLEELNSSTRMRDSWNKSCTVAGDETLLRDHLCHSNGVSVTNRPIGSPH